MDLADAAELLKGSDAGIWPIGAAPPAGAPRITPLAERSGSSPGSLPGVNSDWERGPGMMPA